jgi:hypothetical protein
VDAVRVERPPGAPGRLWLRSVALFDVLTQRVTPVSAASAYVSDAGRLREVAASPSLRLFELPDMRRARVVGKLRVMPDEAAVLRALELLPQIGLDPRREALVPASEAAAITLPREARPARAEMARVEPDRLVVRAEGPGLLVVSEAWDPGWSAAVDGARAAIHRVNHAQMGVVLPGGLHHVTFTYRVRGLFAGLALCAAGLFALAGTWARARVWRGRAERVTVPLPRATTGGRE